MYYNRSVYPVHNYYNTLFMKNFYNNHFKNHRLYSYKKIKCTFLFFYPILYKKTILYQMRGLPLRRKKMKNRLNLNQSVFLESRTSRNKVFLQVPINSKWFFFSY